MSASADSARSVAKGRVGVPYDRFELHPLSMKKNLDGACAGNLEGALHWNGRQIPAR
ncbi:MAG TPA: hypothetical protein VLW65_18370 [Bryobacteraceae bacterium]|nr:hypothetical protein [Bryobacteraceae bacterium]